jgi:hypothetical protein
MVVAVLQTTVLQEGVADRLLGQHLADHGSTPREAKRRSHGKRTHP